MDPGLLVAIVLGVLQGTLEWLPVSSEGLISIFVTGLGYAPDDAVGLSLFLHAGTGVAAGAFYRDRLRTFLGTVGEWSPRTAFADRDRADLTFLVVATVVSGVVGVGVKLLLEEFVGGLTGGIFLAVVGVLLVGTGLLQRRAGFDDAPGEGSDDDRSGGDLEPRSDGGEPRTEASETVGRSTPDAVDAVLVGALQGLALLPGVSRSGTTASALLLRGHDGPRSLELSFVLSVPAALGAGGLAVVEEGGLPTIQPVPAVVALGLAAVVGYLTIDALTRLVGQLRFWVVCVSLGALGVLGGTMAAVV
jgi:undecaprenyl-diphosphatase